MIYFAEGSKETELSQKEIKEALFSVYGKLEKRKRVLAVPPDITRMHSGAGKITSLTYEYFQERLTDILPAIGTHYPMTEREIETMYNGVPNNLFRVHEWRKDLVKLGEVPPEFINEISEGELDYGITVKVNRLLAERKHDLILSIGQVVPHEVAGMANYNKNIFIGAGGAEIIDRSHFLGAVFGMERIMGRADTPVRKVLSYASENFAEDLPIVYVLTVIGSNDRGDNVIRGLFIGDDYECFRLASALSAEVNVKILDKPLKKVVVYLEPHEYKSTWLGNKSIYRTRMAIADGGELVILAPGLKAFGEDAGIDKLIRKYGYVTTPEILEFVDKNKDLQNNLSAAAHLIHGSSEGRFKITYCPGSISEEEIENVNFNYEDLGSMMKKYVPQKLGEGFNIMPEGEEIYYISNPGVGLWADRNKFN